MQVSSNSTIDNQAWIASGPVPLGGARVLIVEDKAIVAMDLVATVGEAGGHAEGPLFRLSDAMSYSGLEELDAALLDVDIDGDEVFEFADRLKANGVPMVFHTGRPDIARLSARYPDAPIVCKPCMSRNVVFAILTAILTAATARRAAS